MNQWYIQHSNKIHGPIDDATLKKLASGGKINASTRIRKGEDGQWSECSKINGLFTVIAKQTRSELSKVESKPNAPINAVIKNAQFFVADQPTSLSKNEQVVQGRSIQDQRHCPFCAEPIALAAVKCRHCSEFLDPALRHAGHQVQTASQPVINNVLHSATPMVVSNNNNNAVAAAASSASSSQALIPRWSPWAAAVFALLLPGLGHLYKGRSGEALIWLMFVGGTYATFGIPAYFLNFWTLLTPGVALHGLNIFSAALGHRYHAPT